MTVPSPRCNAQTVSGHPCHYPEDRCPLHTQASSLLPPPSSQPRSPRSLGQLALDRALDGQANPLAAARLIHAARDLQRIEDPVDEERALKEVELRGRLMYGMPPHNDEAWDLARECFTDEALGEFVRWAKNFDLPSPADLANLAPVPQNFDDD